MRICLVCDEKYIAKQIYEEFLTKKRKFDKEMEQIKYQKDVYDELIFTLEKQENDLLFEVFNLLDKKNPKTYQKIFDDFKYNSFF
jgi:hypothetical protein